MRPIHLLLAVLALACALCGLLFSIGGWRGEIHAGTGGGDGLSSAERSAVLDGVANRNAASGDDAEDGARRTPLAPPPRASDATAAAPKSDKPVLQGRVIAAGTDGDTGVEGAVVFASTSSDWVQLPLDLEPDGLPKNWVRVEKTTTDSEGRYRFESLKPGPLRIAARAGGFAPRYVDRLDLPDKREFTAPDIRLERGVVLSGKIVDREGHGIGGARLLAALDMSSEGKSISVPGRGVPLATSSDDGTFRIDQLAAGPWHLIIDSPAHAIGEEEGRTERAGEAKQGLVFVLDYGIEIQGTVKAGDAALPAGMRIDARQSPEREKDAPPSDAAASAAVAARARHALCADDGAFVVRGLQPGMRYRLSAWQKSDDPSGWKRMNGVDTVQAYAGARGVELTYKPESAIVFRALDEKSGAPLTELSVFAGIGRERILRDEKNEVLRAFPDGRVRFAELRPQVGGKPAVLRVSAVGHADYERKDLVLKPGSDLDLGDIRLAPQAVVRVHVVDDESGAPVVNARVIASATKTDDEIGAYFQSGADQDYWHEAKISFGRTGADGVARLSSTPGKQTTIRAGAKGFLASEPLHVALGETDQDAELRLKHGGSVVVHVTDGASHPVAGVGIAHRKPGEHSDEDGWINDTVEQKTDAEGVARFDALPRGTHSFRVQDQQAETWSDGNAPRAAGWLDAVVGDAGTATLEFNVPARGGLLGCVRENGAPLKGARLKLVEARTENDGEGNSWGGPNDPLSTVTNHEGNFKFEGIRCGSYTLIVSHPARRMSARRAVAVAVDPRRADVDLDVASIEGRVTDLDGRGLPGLEVIPVPKQGAGDDQPYQMVVIEDDRGGARVNYEQSSRRSEKTDANGRYVLRGLATEQPIFVQVRGESVENASSPEITLAPDEVRRGIDFALRRAGSIEVRLNGNPAEQTWFQARAYRVADGKETMVHSVYLGTWSRAQTIRSLAPGHYKVVLSLGGAVQARAMQEVETDVAASETSRVSFDAR